MRKLTGITAVLGLVLVVLSMISRYLDLIPDRSRNTIMVIGFAMMLLGTLWRVVHDMQQPDEEE